LRLGLGESRVFQHELRLPSQAVRSSVSWPSTAVSSSPFCFRVVASPSASYAFCLA
jgi:hypothetical protein